MKHLEDERGVALVLEIVLVAIVLAAVGFAVYASTHGKKPATQTAKASPSPSSKPSPSPSVTPVDPMSGWKTDSLKKEKLSFRYPSTWALTRQTVSSGETVNITNGGFKIILDSLEPGTDAGLGGMGGAVSYNAAVGSFKLGSGTAYLLDSATSGSYTGTVLSSCGGAKKCLVKSQSSSNYVDTGIYYGKGPDNFSPTNPTYQEALKIVETLHY